MMERMKLEAKRFRQAIDEAHDCGEFDWEYEPCHRDRMRWFPVDCCDDTCDLLWHFFFKNHGIVLKQVSAFFAAENTRHNWLETETGLIVDLTGDQFSGRPSVFVDKDDGFYRKMTDKHVVDVVCIMNIDRLWRDYSVIMKYFHQS